MYPHVPKGRHLSIRDELQKIDADHTLNEANHKEATDLLLATEDALNKEKRGIFMNGDRIEKLENLRLDLLGSLHSYEIIKNNIRRQYNETIGKVAPQSRQNYYNAGIPVPVIGLTSGGMLDLKSGIYHESFPTDNVQYISYRKHPADNVFHASSLIRDPTSGDVEFFNPTGEPLSSLNPVLQNYVKKVANGHTVVECNMKNLQSGGSCASFTMHRLSQAHVPYQEWIDNLKTSAHAIGNTSEEHVLSAGMSLPTEPIEYRPEVQKQYKHGGIVFSYGRVNGRANK